MPKLLKGWEHDPEDLDDADRAAYEKAARPARPVVLVMRGQTGKLGHALGPRYAQAFATLAEAFARAEQVWERSGTAIDPEWISDGTGRYLPMRH
jgi:hypothetical protein